MKRDPRLSGHDLAERIARQTNGREVAFGDHGRVAPAPSEDRELAEELPGTQTRDLLLVAHDLGLTLGDHEEGRAPRRAGGHDHGAARELDLLGELRYPAKLPFRQPGEQRHLGEQPDALLAERLEPLAAVRCLVAVVGAHSSPHQLVTRSIEIPKMAESSCSIGAFGSYCRYFS